MTQNVYRRGFTIIELVIALALIGALIVVILPSFISFRRSSALNTEAEDLVTVINRARLLSVSSKNDQQFGVHFDTDRAVLYQGPTYTSTDPTNEIHVLNSLVTLSGTTINGGGSEVLFQKVTGATSQNATTTLVVTGTTASTTILILPTGVVTAS